MPVPKQHKLGFSCDQPSLLPYLTTSGYSKIGLNTRIFLGSSWNKMGLGAIFGETLSTICLETHTPQPPAPTPHTQPWDLKRDARARVDLCLS